MKTQIFILVIGILIMFSLTNCTTIRPGEVGLKQRYGVLKSGTFTGGVKIRSPFSAKIIKINTRIIEHKTSLHLPTKDGLEITAEVSLFYHVKSESARYYYTKFGENYDNGIVISALNSSARESSILYNAKELIVIREELEKAITEKIKTHIVSFGYSVDNFLILDLTLPPEIAQAIKNKITAEQTSLQTVIDIERKKKELAYDIDKQRIENNYNIEKQLQAANFAIEKQKKEAERMQIEAEAIKKAQQTINESLTDKMLKYKSLEISKNLVTSPNSKLIITDGKSVGIHNDISDNK
ncbi:MAG: prohibitin family protein [Bacteroidota bacterium]|nr:prohibitin family protein [Bacteroidota bacterium]